MKVLISVASRHGATLGLARAIREELELAGLEADVVAPERVGDVSGYDAVVIGSGVYAGRWLAPARELVERELPALLQRPVWLFSSGPIGDPPKPSQPPVEGLEITRRTNALDHQVFEGRLDRSGLGFAERAIVRVVGAATGDYRQWDVVRAWARRIAATLVPESESAAAATFHAAPEPAAPAAPVPAAPAGVA